MLVRDWLEGKGYCVAQEVLGQVVQSNIAAN